MKVSIASYDNTTDTHNSFSEITEALDFNIQHSFNTPARCTITISDPDGSLHQNYTVSSGAVYIGAGRVKVEHPTGTTVFDGRVMKARHDGEAGRTYLLCFDWLHQLSDQRVNYDMREDLDDSGTTQSTLAADFDRTFEAVFTSGASYYAYDRSITFSDDEFTGYDMVIPSSSLGTTVTSTVGPHSVDVTAPTSGDGAMDDTISDSELPYMWNNNSNSAYASDNDDSYYEIALEFKINVTEGSLYDSFESWIFNMAYTLQNGQYEGEFYIEFADESAMTMIGTFNADTNANDIQQVTFEVPESTFDRFDLIDGSGNVTAVIRVYVQGGTSAELDIYYLVSKFEANVNGYDSAFNITSMGYDHEFTVDTNLDTTGLGLWEGCEYCVVQDIYNHIDTIASNGTQFVSLSTSVESNTVISTKKFNEKTHLEILKYLSSSDSAVFWIDLGTTTLNWKNTFDEGTTNLSDSDILAWTTAERDFEPVRNEYHVYGQRVGNNQLFLDTNDLGTDPGTTSKGYFGTRSETIRSVGATTKPELIDTGKALVKQNDDVRFHLKASVPGYSHEVGTQLNVTSSILGLTDQKYVVTDFQYDSKNDRTVITLHPRVSVGYQDWKPMGTDVRDVNETAEDARVDTYVPEVL